MWIALIAVSSACALLLAGWRYPRFHQPILRDGMAADVLHALVNGVLLDVPIAMILALVTDALGAFAGDSSLAILRDAPIWVQVAIFIPVGDLLKWSIHFAHHRVGLLWRLHRLHHSSRDMDSLSHARAHPLEIVFNRLPFLTTFVVVLGIDLRIIACYSAIDVVQGLWVHSNTHRRTPRLNYFLATQEFHHWHHADDPAAVNKNFGGFLSVWDWVFGTAYCPADREVPRFGTPDLEPPSGYTEQLLSPLRDRVSRHGDAIPNA